MSLLIISPALKRQSPDLAGLWRLSAGFDGRTPQDQSVSFALRLHAGRTLRCVTVTCCVTSSIG